MYEYFVGGIKTNISLFRRILRDPDFIAGNVDTGYLDRLLDAGVRNAGRLARRPQDVAALAAALFTQMENGAAASGFRAACGQNSERFEQLEAHGAHGRFAAMR